MTHCDTLDEQIAAINRFTDQRVDALLVGPIATIGLGEAVGRAQAAGIPVIILATKLGDGAPDATVESNHRKGAELAAAHVVERIGGAGEVAHVIGPMRVRDNVERAEGVRHVLGQHPEVRLAFERESPNWRSEMGAELMREALAAHPQLRGVCVANDTLAMGVLEAIEGAGRAGQVVVTGFDASAEALVAINEGRMSATVRQQMRGIGRTGIDLAVRAARGDAVPAHEQIDVLLITSENLIDTTLEAVYLLPGVLRDVVDRGEELQRAQDAIIHARDAVIEAQETALRELSSPLIPLSSSVMVMPLIGAIDSRRAQQVMESLLEGVSANAARLIILDITGVPLVDTQVANALIQAAQAVKLLGAQVVLTGIRPEVAQALVGLGVNLSGIVTRSTLQSGIAYGLKLV